MVYAHHRLKLIVRRWLMQIWRWSRICAKTEFLASRSCIRSHIKEMTIANGDTFRGIFSTNSHLCSNTICLDATQPTTHIAMLHLKVPFLVILSSSKIYIIFTFSFHSIFVIKVVAHRHQFLPNRVWWWRQIQTNKFIEFDASKLSLCVFGGQSSNRRCEATQWITQRQSSAWILFCARTGWRSASRRIHGRRTRLQAAHSTTIRTTSACSVQELPREFEQCQTILSSRTPRSSHKHFDASKFEFDTVFDETATWIWKPSFGIQIRNKCSGQFECEFSSGRERAQLDCWWSIQWTGGCQAITSNISSATAATAAPTIYV